MPVLSVWIVPFVPMDIYWFYLSQNHLCVLFLSLTSCWYHVLYYHVFIGVSIHIKGVSSSSKSSQSKNVCRWSIIVWWRSSCIQRRYLHKDLRPFELSNSVIDLCCVLKYPKSVKELCVVWLRAVEALRPSSQCLYRMIRHWQSKLIHLLLSQENLLFEIHRCCR